MARTIEEIKKSMTDVFVVNEHAIKAYELASGDTFEAKFSRTSIESILFYVVAACAWTVEVLFDRHKREVTEMINELKPHTRRWYANKAKAFQYGQELVPDTDYYNNTGLTEEQIEGKRVVKFAAVTESNGHLSIKVAGGNDGDRHKLTAIQQTALVAYMNEVRDAGVNLSVINQDGELFSISIDIYYSPQILNHELKRLDDGQETVRNTIKNFVENLPFDGEYKSASLIEALLQVEGVATVNLIGAYVDNTPIGAKILPAAGYFKLDNVTLNPIEYVVGD